MLLCAPPIRRLSVHGLRVELDCSLLAIYRQVSGLLGRLPADSASPGASAALGVVRPYIANEVLPHLSKRARRVDAGPEAPELYQDGERFWLVDDRWGITQINLLKGQWRSWVLPRPRLDEVHCAERAVIWPMAQLLRPKGLHLLPAVSAVRDGRGVLILCPFSVEPELTALIRGGWRIIGQRWTAVREENGMPVLLHVPWRVECQTASYGAASVKRQSRWIDLTSACFSSPEPHAVCQTVLVVQPGRRPRAYLRELDNERAATVLRQSWPIAELYPGRRPGQMARYLAQRSQCFDAQLSHDPRDLLVVLRSLYDAPPAQPPKPVLELTLPHVKHFDLRAACVGAATAA